MANSLSSLLGNFGFGGQNMPTTALLGDFYDPAAARNYQMKQMLLGMGMGLMAEKGFGKGAALAIAAGDRAGNQYRENALDAYRIKTAQDEQAKADQRYQQEWDYRVGQDKAEAERQKRLDAQNEALFGYKMDALEGDAALRQGKQTAVESWMQPFQSQGGTIPMSPGVRAIGRAGGVEGPSATDQWRYSQIQPAITAGDYETAYSGLNAVPPKPEQYTLSPGAARYDEFGNKVAEGPPKTPDTVINNNTGENAFAKKGGEIQAQRYGDMVAEGDKANEMLGSIGALRDIGSQINTGKGAEVMAALGPWAQSLGVEIDGLGEAQAYEAIVSKLAPTLRTPGAGASSDFDARQFLLSLPQLGRTPEGNAIIQNTLESVANWKVQASAIAQQALYQKITPEEADRQIRALGDPWSLWKRAQKQMPKPASPPSIDPATMTDEQIRKALGG